MSPRWFQKKFLWCVKHLDASIFFGVPSAYIPIFFHQTDFYSCFDVLNKLKFSMTLVCLRPFSLNPRILQWMFYFHRTILWNSDCFSQFFLSPRWFQNFLLWCVKHLDASIFVGVPSAYIAPFFIKLIFVPCFDMLNKLKFSITLVCCRSVSLNQTVWKIECLSQLFLSPRWFENTFCVGVLNILTLPFFRCTGLYCHIFNQTDF